MHDALALQLHHHAPTAMDGEQKPPEGFYRVLLDRFESLEASHHKLKEQFQVVVKEKTTGVVNDATSSYSYPGWADIPWACFAEGPYKRVLEYMGHAVHVSGAGSGEIVFWNCAAEKLYGYKEYEVVGQRAVDLLFHEEHHRLAMAIMERLRTGESWSGQLPLKRRSGQSFIALVTKSPLYEDGELAGIVTVSSDAAVFNKINPNEQSKSRAANLKNLPWHQRPQIAAVPHLASSVSNLASKVLSRARGEVTSDTCRSGRDSEESEVESHDARVDRPPRAPISKGIGRSRAEVVSLEKDQESAQPSKIAVRFLEKLGIGASSNLEKVKEENIQQNILEDNSNGTCLDSPERKHSNLHVKSFVNSDNSHGCIEINRHADQLPRNTLQSDGNKHATNFPCTNHLSWEENSGESENDNLHVVVNSVIQWEDLKLKEEIGQGSFAVVYRGIWKGSDVAVKIYSGNQYAEETLLDYKKEIDIMRRLRHPNVLLFMGAVCTEERIAIITEYMPRGSLFKTLHRNNQPLDIRRRLRMALDVARGVNYLHNRNPPIVHRDLKSSNLLVDRSWTVKVGDFGLSKLKYTTFITARSGRGTPQWMAPEVLRNERSTEKSDVFSFGVILWELMTECIPWSDLNALQVVGVVGFMNRRLDIPGSVDPQVSSIISECWRSNPEDRPSFKDIIHRMTDLVVQSGGGAMTRMA